MQAKSGFCPSTLESQFCFRDDGANATVMKALGAQTLFMTSSSYFNGRLIHTSGTRPWAMHGAAAHESHCQSIRWCQQWQALRASSAWPCSAREGSRSSCDAQFQWKGLGPWGTGPVDALGGHSSSILARTAVQRVLVYTALCAHWQYFIPIVRPACYGSATRTRPREHCPDCECPSR